MYSYPGSYDSVDPVNVSISYSNYYLMFWASGYNDVIYFQGIYDKNTSSFYGIHIANDIDSNYLFIAQIGLIDKNYLEWTHTKDDVRNGYDYGFVVIFNDNGFAVNRIITRKQKTQTSAGHFDCLYYEV